MKIIPAIFLRDFRKVGKKHTVERPLKPKKK